MCLKCKEPFSYQLCDAKASHNSLSLWEEQENINAGLAS